MLIRNRMDERRHSPNDCQYPMLGSPKISGINQFQSGHTMKAKQTEKNDMVRIPTNTSTVIWTNFSANTKLL
jgi:hypothetical protein